jgi:hypothetical protein
MDSNSERSGVNDAGTRNDDSSSTPVPRLISPHSEDADRARPALKAMLPQPGGHVPRRAARLNVRPGFDW